MNALSCCFYVICFPGVQIYPFDLIRLQTDESLMLFSCPDSAGAWEARLMKKVQAVPADTQNSPSSLLFICLPESQSERRNHCLLTEKRWTARIHYRSSRIYGWACLDWWTLPEHVVKAALSLSCCSAKHWPLDAQRENHLSVQVLINTEEFVRIAKVTKNHPSKNLKILYIREKPQSVL